MNYLRKVKEVIRFDRKINEEVRDELRVESVMKVVEKRQPSWWGRKMQSNTSINSM